MPYHGFTLTTRRDESGGWHPIVKDRHGRLLNDEIEASWISQSEAEGRAVCIAKRELNKIGETELDDPDWGDVVPPLTHAK